MGLEPEPAREGVSTAPPQGRPWPRTKLVRASLAALSVLLVSIWMAHRVEPGVSVQSVRLEGGTPALIFTPREASRVERSSFGSAVDGPNRSAGKAHRIVLMGHGFTASKETLFRFGEAFAAAGFQACAVDFPGHGQSPRRFFSGKGSFERTLGDAGKALGRVDVYLGHSMGGWVGAEAVNQGYIHPKLFIAVGALPAPFAKGPSLLLLAGRFEEFLPPAQLRARTDARVVISTWCDHASEPYDRVLVNAAVEAACMSVGEAPPPAPSEWRWRVLGLFLGVPAALCLVFCLMELLPGLAVARGLLFGASVIAVWAFTAGTWVNAVPNINRLALLILAVGLAFLIVTTAMRLRLPWWVFPLAAGVFVLACVLVAAFPPAVAKSWWTPVFHLGAFLGAFFAWFVLLGTALGRLAAWRGLPRDGAIATALFVGYVIAQWIPRVI